MGQVAAVVLAGGESRRFGTDKLAAVVDGLRLLDRAIEALPAEVTLIIVGPERPTRRPATFVREDPVGGGPAAALVAGLRHALQTPVDAIVVFPADAPLGGQAALILLQHLTARPDGWVVMGTDTEGREQPLQLALRPDAAASLVRAAGPTAGSGASARRLLHSLEPPAVTQRLEVAEVFDIDTVEQQQTWHLRSSAAIRGVRAALAAGAAKAGPLVVAVDGRSGTGKSTLANALALEEGACLVHGDDFYSPDVARLTAEQRETLTDAEVAGSVFDWSRLRSEALEPLTRSRPAIFRPYDWEGNDGSLAAIQQIEPGRLVVLEGVYAARPELSDLIDLAVLVEADPAVRWARLTQRPDDPSWTRFWDRGEDYYFRVVRPSEVFDLRTSGQ